MSKLVLIFYILLLSSILIFSSTLNIDTNPIIIILVMYLGINIGSIFGNINSILEDVK